VPVYRFHSPQPGSGSQRTDTVGHPFYKKGADHLTNQFKKHLGQHPGIVALLEKLVKAGRLGSDGSYKMLWSAEP
jgi:hypothetical protein